jgi:hypothetical protein
MTNSPITEPFAAVATRPDAAGLLAYETKNAFQPQASVAASDQIHHFWPVFAAFLLVF